MTDKDQTLEVEREVPPSGGQSPPAAGGSRNNRRTPSSQRSPCSRWTPLSQRSPQLSLRREQTPSLRRVERDEPREMNWVRWPSSIKSSTASSERSCEKLNMEEEEAEEEEGPKIFFILTKI